MERNMTCISCPIGCYLTVTLADGMVTNVAGNNCPRGKTYAEKECTNPVRMVTSTVRLYGSDLNVLPVKTKEAIPKDKIFACVQQLAAVEVNAPVAVGDVVVENICNTGVDIVATRTVEVM